MFGVTRMFAFALVVAAGAGGQSGCAAPGTCGECACVDARAAGDAMDDAAGGGDAASQDGGASDAGPQQSCTDPVMTLEVNEAWDTEGYNIFNHTWNTECAETRFDDVLYACSYGSWYVESNQTSGCGLAVKTYPAVRKIYGSHSGPSVGSLNTLTSTYGSIGPQTGTYNVAYDLWLNGIATSGCVELMIWTERYPLSHMPPGDVVGTITTDGVAYDVHKANWGWTYLALVPDSQVFAGSIDLLEILDWLVSNSHVPPNSTVDQISYGIEINSTNGNTETFEITGFSVTSD